MSRTKEAILECRQNNRSQLDWRKPKPNSPDALDHAIQKWMEVTGDDGSTARYKIALLVAKELDWMSQP